MNAEIGDRYYIKAVVSPSLRHGIWRYKRREDCTVSEAVERLLQLGITSAEKRARPKERIASGA